MQVIRSLVELDTKLAECDAAEAVSDDAMRALFGSFRMDPPTGLPTDPFAPEYRDAQLAFYRELTGHDYATAREITRFDVSAALHRPFPFTTGSTATAGEYFMAIGHVLKTMALPPGSRVLEFGPGWGWTSVWLAQLDHHVTVIDIEPCFCELVARRAAREGVTIETVNDDFFWVERQSSRFDAVLFYDCFHHCDDHMRLLRALVPVVAPEGRVFFGAEPIIPDFPQQWGLRLDGWSLWGIRKQGWMELGFRDDYFARALAAAGWFGRKVALPGADRLCVWEARHRAAAVFRFDASDPRIHTQVGRRHDGAIVFTGAARGTGLYGPYIDLPAGSYVARIVFRPGAPLRGRAAIDIASDAGAKCRARGIINTSAGTSEVAEITFASDTDLSQVEVRMFCEPGFIGTVESVAIAPIDPGA